MDNASLAKLLKARFPNLIEEALENRGEVYAIVRKAGLRSLASALKKDPDLNSIC